MSLHPSLHQLRDEFRKYAKTQAPDILSFCGGALIEDHDEVELDANQLPMIDKLANLDGKASTATGSLLKAVIEAAPNLAWRQSYTVEDEGFDENYLENYGWFNLIAPSGPFVSDKMRLSVGYWGQGLHYPNHWHEPEEIYLTIAGSALYVSEGREPVRGGPGTTSLGLVISAVLYRSSVSPEVSPDHSNGFLPTSL